MIVSYKSYAQTGKTVITSKGCLLVAFMGRCQAVGYLQVHDSAAEPSAGAVPLKVLDMSGGAGQFPQFVEFLPATLVNGLTFCMSSTSGTYMAAAIVFDVEGEIDSISEDYTVGGFSTSTVGSAKSLTVWAATNPTPKLFDVTITNGEAFAVYAMVFGYTVGIAAGSEPMWTSTSIAAGATATFTFGYGGLNTQQFDPVGTLKMNCALLLSVSATAFNNTGIGNNSTLTGRYKAL